MKRVVAVVFAGQGAEEPGVGLEWRADPLLAVASAACELDVAQALARFTSDLRRTSVLQPLLVALGLVAWSRVSATGPRVDLVAGHSVGEIAAWAATGALSAQTAIELARARGVAMEREANLRPGTMVALPADVDVAAALACGRAAGAIDLAARNGPRQIVLSGEHAAIAAVERAFGGRRLGVTGAWHSSLVAGACADLASALARVAPRETSGGPRLVTCLDGRVLRSGEAPDLVAQLGAPVAWDRVLSTFAREGVTDVVALAPGRVMRGLLRDGLGPRVRLRLAETDAQIAGLARSLHEESHP